MTRALIFVFATSAAATVLAAPTSASSSPVQATKPAAGVVASVTVTGCLERWNSDEATSPTGAPSDQPPAGAKYMLTGVEGQTKSTTAAGGGSPEKAEPETRYLLLASKTVDYESHLHHKVRIVGTIAPQPTEGASPTERVLEPSTRETNLPTGPESRAYRTNLVEVASLTMVSRSCGQ